MKKKIFSIFLAGTMVASVASMSAISASADDGEGLALGDYGKLGNYTPSSGVKTNRLMFAMPAAWQNDTTKNEKCNGVAGIYWWSGFDTPDNKAGGHGWPGYSAQKVTGEEGVDNLYAIDVPTYGNGETGNATQIIWNNYIDGGMETDPVKNPFYDAAAQSKDFPGQYYSRTDEHENYDVLFRYIYVKSMKDAGVKGADALDIKSENFWVDANKLCAAYNGEDWNKLSADEKTYQVDNVLDANLPDLSEFGDYASNFFDEDLVGEPDCYPAEEMQGFGESFHFNNMVFVVSFDPNKMIPSPVSGKIGYDGDFYFYYGKGEYGTWPTKELNEQYGGVSGNFAMGEYVDPNYKPPVPTVVPTTEGGTVPAPSGTDAGSSTSDGGNGNDSDNNSNGAIATGQASLAVIVFIVLVAGIGVFFFSRRKYQK